MKITHTGVSQLARETGYSVASVSKKLHQGKTIGQIRQDAARAGIKPVILTAPVTSAQPNLNRSSIKAAPGNGKLKQPKHGVTGTGTGTGTGTPASSAPSTHRPNPAHPGRVKDENFYQAQARKETILADLRELEYQEKVNRLIPVDLLNSWFSGCIIKARDILLQIGPELRDRLAQETDPVKVDEIVTGEIRRALAELATFNTGQPPTQETN